MATTLEIAVQTFKQRVDFACSPQKLFSYFTEPQLVKEFTKSTEGFVCENKVGGRMRLFNGQIMAENLEIVPNRKLVQKWRAKSWPEGHQSKVTFELSGAAAGPTVLQLTHEDVPLSDFANVEKGWTTHYWDPLKALVEK